MANSNSAQENVNSAYQVEVARRLHVASGRKLSAKLGSLAKLIAAAAILALSVRAFIIQPFAIPSTSMSPALQAGDFIFVNKMAYGWTTASLPISRALAASGDGQAHSTRLAAKPVAYGDVIVFVSPNGQDYVKRVVARGGDRIAMQNGQLIVNGTPVPCISEGEATCRETLPNGRSYLIQTTGTSPLNNMGEISVPDGHYFVLGDNRNHSADSRLTRGQGGVGFVPDGHVVGRASNIFFSIRDTVQWDRIGRKID